MTAPQLDAFFEEYVAAFVEQDVERLCAMWKYPAFMVYDGKQRVFDRAAFRDNAVRLCRFYADQGMARTEKDVIDIVPLTATTAAVRTNYRMYRVDETTLVEWTHAYLLSEASDEVSIVAAMPDDENRAWRSLADSKS
jgi:hypothetical protein